MDNTQQYEIIFCIVNYGFTDIVMETAKQNGARGGTIINARGTGNEETEKFYGIVISPDKEIVMIIIEKENKDKILHAIYETAGLENLGQGIIFSLPISHVLGINKENKLNTESKGS